MNSSWLEDKKKLKCSVLIVSGLNILKFCFKMLFLLAILSKLLVI